jgi:hypothetical protein
MPRGSTASVWVVFGLGLGKVTQIPVVAVQNSLDRRELGT